MRQRRKVPRKPAIFLSLVLALAAPDAARAQTLIYLARHGETEGNVKGILQGQTNSSLSARGRQQAERLAAFLRERKIQAVYASSLGRAVETAQVVAVAAGVALEPLDDLREIHLGVLEGRELSAAATQAEFARITRAIDYRPEGGESFADLAARAGKVVSEILKKHPNQSVAIVAHGMINGAILAHLLSMSPAEAAALPSQPHDRLYLVYKLSPSAASLIWEVLPEK